MPADPWFFYGLPVRAALIQRDNGRIWMVTDEPDLIDQFCTLFHSKIELMRVDIRTCSNFADDLIDNTVCTDWYVDWPNIADRPRWYSHPAQGTRITALDHVRDISGSQLLNHARPLDPVEQELKNQLMLLHHIRYIAKHMVQSQDDTQTFDTAAQVMKEFGVFDNIIASELLIEHMYEPIKQAWLVPTKCSQEIAAIMHIQDNSRLYD